MSYYQRHLFICVNQREANAERTCCANCGSQELLAYAKSKIKSKGLNGPGKLRINGSRCMDRCEQGPVCVVYPDAVWYTYIDESDLDEIIDSHLLAGIPVERLRLG
ncbi:MAG: (2Fe-2S) ferredoxin domain-containing protein [Xanthomonadales bacterium]|nr:(2Fe-2S) ferredoxin domain-containing protein [Xanthomonadales bacterium]